MHGRLYGDALFEIDKILGKREVDGRVQYQIAWKGKDTNGKPWPASWEPKHFVGKCFRDAYEREQVEKTLCSIELDVRALSTMVPQSIAAAVMADRPKEKGQEHELQVPALTLEGLAAYQLEQISEETGVEIVESYDPKDKITTKSITLMTMEQISLFVKFHEFMSDGHGYGALRYKLGRKHDVDFTSIGVPMVIQYYNNKHTKGCVTFEVKFPTVFFNGIYGTPQIPHMDKGMLKKKEHLNQVVRYARATLPRRHSLIQKGWHKMSAHRHTLAAHIAVPDHCTRRTHTHAHTHPHTLADHGSSHGAHTSSGSSSSFAIACAVSCMRVSSLYTFTPFGPVRAAPSFVFAC